MPGAAVDDALRAYPRLLDRSPLALRLVPPISSGDPSDRPSISRTCVTTACRRAKRTSSRCSRRPGPATIADVAPRPRAQALDADEHPRIGSPTAASSRATVGADDRRRSSLRRPHERAARPPRVHQHLADLEQAVARRLTSADVKGFKNVIAAVEEKKRTAEPVLAGSPPRVSSASTLAGAHLRRRSSR